MKLLALCFAGSALMALGQNTQLTWQGEVDGNVLISVRDDRVDLQERQGNAVVRPNYRFFDRLPPVEQEVRLNVRQGRGTVRIVEQPRARNNYTLVVSIDDRQAGSGNYDLEFAWRTDGRGISGTAPASGGPYAYDPAPARGRYTPTADEASMTWSGSVEEEAEVEVRGRRAVARAVRGQQVSGERADFTRNLPVRRAVQVRIVDRQGRGNIVLLEQPSEQNNYTALVRVRDRQPGADNYQFTLAWNRPGGRDARDDDDDALPTADILRPGRDRGRVRDRDDYNRAGRGRAVNGSPGSLRWTGRVDGRVRVIVEGDRTYVETLQGQDVLNQRADFTSGVVGYGTRDAQLAKRRGRGRVELIEQPNEANGNRIVFEINDSDGGQDDYEVELRWN